MPGVYFVIRKAVFVTPSVEAAVQYDTFSFIPLPIVVMPLSTTQISEESPCPAGDVPWEGVGGSSLCVQFKELNDQVSWYVFA